MSIAAAPNTSSADRDAARPTAVVDFACREIAFGSIVDARRIGAYDEIAPGVLFGFPPDRPPDVMLMSSGEGEPAVIVVAALGETAWLTLEIRLDGTGLQRMGYAFVRVVAHGTPRSRIRQILRVWETPDSFFDVPQRAFALGPQGTDVAMCLRAGQRLQELAAPPYEARLIWFLPQNEARYGLESLAIAPAGTIG